jgi:hypothetical protein
LKQRRALGEDLRKFAQKPNIRELGETVRRMQESGVAEKLMGRMRPASPPQPDNVSKKRKRSVGRHRSVSPEQIEEGIRILRSQPRMTVAAACATLRDAGIKGSPSALYRLIIKPAYA